MCSLGGDSMTLQYYLNDYQGLMIKRKYNLLDDTTLRHLTTLEKMFNDTELVNFTGSGAKVLKKHYIDGLTYQEIAAEIGYSERHVYRLRDYALEQFSIVLGIPIE